MPTEVIPSLLQRTLARLRVRGVPSLLREISALTLGDEPRLMRTALGDVLHLDPKDGDQCMMYYGIYGRSILHFARQILRPGDTALDAGGHVGYFATAFARLVGSEGEVVTCEPDPRVWPRLLQAVHRNELLQVTPRNLGLSDRSGTATLHVSPTAGWSTLLDCDFEKLQSVQVTTRALDDLVAEEDLGWDHLRLVKLDVEGSEIAALRGMAATVRRFRPFLICELNSECLRAIQRTPDDLLDEIRSLGYRIQAIVEPQGLLRGAAPDLLDVTTADDLPWRFGDLLCSPGGDR